MVGSGQSGSEVSLVINRIVRFKGEFNVVFCLGHGEILLISYILALVAFV